jgi:hypothetical protein
MGEGFGSSQNESTGSSQPRLELSEYGDEEYDTGTCCVERSNVVMPIDGQNGYAKCISVEMRYIDPMIDRGIRATTGHLWM